MYMKKRSEGDLSSWALNINFCLKKQKTPYVKIHKELELKKDTIRLGEWDTIFEKRSGRDNYSY